MSGHLLGNSSPLGKQFVLIVFCLFIIFIYLPLWLEERDLPFDCSSSCSLLFYNLYSQNTNLLPPKPKTSFRRFRQGIQEFHRKYVLVSAERPQTMPLLFVGYTI